MKRRQANRTKARVSRHTRVVIGWHACREAARVRPHAIERIWLSPDVKQDPRFLAMKPMLDWGRLTVENHPESDFRSIGGAHQGIAFFVSETPSVELAELKKIVGPTILLALDQVTDPQNVGSILRTAWLFGVRALLLPQNQAAALTPSVIKVASGGAEHVPVLQVASLQQTLSDFKAAGFWVYGLDASGSSAIWDVKLPEKVIWVAGSEDRGLRSSIRKSCDEMARIPQTTGEASLNVSVATAVALAETARQFRHL